MQNVDGVNVVPSPCFAWFWFSSPIDPAEFHKMPQISTIYIYKYHSIFLLLWHQIPALLKQHDRKNLAADSWLSISRPHAAMQVAISRWVIKRAKNKKAPKPWPYGVSICFNCKIDGIQCSVQLQLSEVASISSESSISTEVGFWGQRWKSQSCSSDTGAWSGNGGGSPLNCGWRRWWMLWMLHCDIH